jgi:hypothetical protein
MSHNLSIKTSCNIAVISIMHHAVEIMSDCLDCFCTLAQKGTRKKNQSLPLHSMEFLINGLPFYVALPIIEQERSDD